MDAENKKWELRMRTKVFAGSVVAFFIGLDKHREELRIIGKQLIRSGTSVGANYREASHARGPEEFAAKIDLCAQEADEPKRSGDRLSLDCPKGEERIKPSSGWNCSVMTAVSIPPTPTPSGTRPTN